MTSDGGDETLSRDLNGAFGDLAWALGRSPGHGGPPPPIHVIIPHDESEMARQRLMLSGYSLVVGPADGRTTWRTPTGDEMVLVESAASWVNEAIMAASRNRDRLGTPRLTDVFELAMRAGSAWGDVQDADDRLIPFMSSLDAETIVKARRLVDEDSGGKGADRADSQGMDID